MTESRPGFILALIGGILGIIIGINLLFFPIFFMTVIPGIITTTGEAAEVGAMLWLILILAIGYIAFSVLILIGGLWMRKAQTCKKGGLFALIFGILGSNILAIIGGILGLIAAGK